MPRGDRAIGVALGIVLGIGIVTALVFFGSEGAIDAPRLSGGGDPENRSAAPPRGSGGRPPAELEPVAAIEVVAGAPPTGGPGLIGVTLGTTLQLRFETDVPLTIEIPRAAISQPVSDGDIVEFSADEPGRFDVLAAASGTRLATIEVSHEASRRGGR